jgi:predicted dehydrogenase
MSEDVRIAVVGTGFMAKAMIAAIGDVEGLQVAAICSRDEQRGRELACALGTGVQSVSFEQALADPGINAVYIANETATHAITSIKALKAGKAVLCEKPLASNSAEARAIVEIARNTGSLFMEALCTPFLPAIQSALHDAQVGSIGTARHFAADFGYPTTAETHPSCYAPEGGGVLLDRGVYLVAMARLALGPIGAVQAHVTKDTNGVDVEASLLLTHCAGSTSQLTASFTSLLANTMTIYGTSGSLSVQAPFLTAEKVVLRRAKPSARPTRLTGWRNLFKKSGGARRAAAFLRAENSRFMSYGRSPYYHELVHFRDLYWAGAIESPVLPMELSLHVTSVLDNARAQA